jgi:hypothetical protein
MKNKPKRDQQVLEGSRGVDEETHSSPARHVLRPNLNSTATISSFLSLEPAPDLGTMLDELDVQTDRIWSGNLGRPEEMLSAQAHTLDAIFNTFAQKAAKNLKNGHLPSTEIYLRMALKAQSQCRTTLETLADIKNPKPATFIRQANIAEQQQINNGPTINGAAGHTRARKKNINQSSNELLEMHHDQRLDKGPTRAAIRNDSYLETVGAIDRSADASREDTK